MPKALFTIAALLLATSASAQSVRTPPPGSPERRAVLDVVRAGPQARFTVRALRIVSARGRALAWVDGDNGVTGNVRYLLTRTGNAPWRDVWSEGDGGSSGCAIAVKHYEWGIALMRRFGTTPAALAPGYADTLAEMRETLANDGAVDCAGDLAGGAVG
jgi:hypothetical protein